MGQAIIYGQTAAKGSSGGSTLTVIAEEGSTITVAKDSNVLTSTDNPAVFKRLEDGVWNATAEKEGKLPISQNIELKTNYELELTGRIYGISRDITASSPHWTRTHDAVGMTATASVGTVAGESDFDNIYPWSEIKRETLDTGDVMVKIPKFYYQRYREGNIEYINIAERAIDGFDLHPLFDRPDGVRDYAYIGAYETSNNNRSVTGATVQVSQTRATMRNNARAKGVEWGLIDVSALSAIQMLYLVEFATNDAQSAIGNGKVSASSANGTGYCNNVPNLTGQETVYGNVIYRGVENLWGNVFEFVDGANWDGNNLLVCNDPSKYADDTTNGYVDLLILPGTTPGYISQMGFDENLPHLMFPSKITGGSASTGFCDYTWVSSAYRVLLVGGCYSDGTSAGLFATRVNIGSDNTNTIFGSRLLYLP